MVWRGGCRAVQHRGKGGTCDVQGLRTAEKIKCWSHDFMMAATETIVLGWGGADGDDGDDDGDDGDDDEDDCEDDCEDDGDDGSGNGNHHYDRVWEATIVFV